MNLLDINIPKTIWMYWHQGFDQAPVLVKKCVKTWKLHHPKWDIKLLDAQTVNDYMSAFPISKEKFELLGLAHRSDLIRTQLLIQHGGVWVDSTCFPIKPLDDWLFEYMESGLFLFYKPGRDRIISNWFIAAEKGNYILKKLLTDLCRYWDNNTFLNLSKKDIWYENWVKKIYNQSLLSTQLWFTFFTRKVLKIYPYMVYHYKFHELISTDPQSKIYWEMMPKLSADGPHKLQRFGLLSPINKDVKEIINCKKTPLFKLTWRINDKTLPKNSVLEYLYRLNK